ncbi:retrotransposon gag domain-containing protein [Tanacetum coccineum]
MTDRSDGMMTGAFISGLRPGRFFKDLIARPPASMEDLFMQAHNFIRADEANAENRLRDSRGVTTDGRSGQNYRDTSRRHKDKYVPRSNTRPNERPNTHKPSFTPLIKSPAEIYATSEGKAILRPPARMFAPAHRRDRTRYSDHLAKGAKTQNNNQNPNSSGASKRGKNQIDWKQKVAEPKEANKILMTKMQWSQACQQTEALATLIDIAFLSKDPIPEHYNGEDPFVIKAYIGGCVVHRVYVGSGSSAEIMYEHCFQQLTDETKASIRPLTSPLIGFAGQVLWPHGIITIPFTLFDYEGKGNKTITTDFMVVRAPSPYNIILGRPGMKQLGAITSTIHSRLKFPIPSGIAIVQGDKLIKSECHQVSRKREREPEEETSHAPLEKKLRRKKWR